MKKNKRSNNRGITLIAVVLTVILATMLIITISVSLRGIGESNHYYQIKTDIIALSKAAQNYYMETGGNLPVLLDGSNNPVPASSEFIENLNAETNELGLAKDRNPNDNEYYYEIDVSLLPEVELQKKDNTYYINEATLTVYSNQPYELFDDNGNSNGKHYTASEKFSGGQFASEYYIGLESFSNGLITNVLISSSNQYSEYAKSGDVITIRLVSSVPFEDYEKQPNTASFLMTFASWKEDNIYLSNVEANSCTVSGPTCEMKYIVPDMEEVEMPVRNKIYFTYNENLTGAFYKKANETDEDMQISDNLMLDSNGNRRYIEYERTTLEIQIAMAINKSLDNNGSINSNMLRNNINAIGEIYLSHIPQSNIPYNLKSENLRYSVDTIGNIEKLTNNYTFTLTTETEGATVTIRNLNDHTSNINDITTENNKTFSINVASGDKIEYNVSKLYYRYENNTNTGGNKPQTVTIDDEDKTVIINLKPNTNFDELIKTETITLENIEKVVNWRGDRLIDVYEWYRQKCKIVKVSNVKFENCYLSDGTAPKYAIKPVLYMNIVEKSGNSETNVASKNEEMGVLKYGNDVINYNCDNSFIEYYEDLTNDTNTIKIKLWVPCELINGSALGTQGKKKVHLDKLSIDVTYVIM